MTAPTYRPPLNPAGYVSQDVYFGQILDEFIADTPADLIWPNSIPTFAAMRRDPTCSAILDGWLLQLMRATWQLDGRGCDPDLVKLVADDMGLRVAGSEEAGAARVRGVSWEDHIASALSSKLTFGHMGFALGAEMRDGQARLNVLAERLPQTLTQIHADPKTGAFLGVSQDAARRENRPQILARNMAWYCNRREGANWAGVSMFRAAWMPFRIKKEMIRIHATSNRRWGSGVPVMEALPGTNPSPAQMTEAMQMAAAARSGEQAGAASPPGFAMKILGLQGGIPDTLAFIEWLDRQVSRAALMPHIELGQGTAGGSRALGTAFIDSWMLALETLATQTAMEATRQIAARLVEWNRGVDEPVPSVVVSGIGSKREVTAESLAKLLDAGALAADPALEAWVRREYRLPEREQPDGVPTGRIFESDIATGTISRNERRAMFNLPPRAGGDELPAVNAPKTQSAPTAPAQPVTASRRRRQTDGQLALPIAAAAEDDARKVQDDYEAALAAALAAWPTLAAPMTADLATQAEQHIAAGNLAALAGLSVGAAAVDGIAAALAGHMAALAGSAARQVVAEAAAQGVSIQPVEPDEQRIGQVAAVAASLIAGAYAAAATRRALQAPTDVAAAVREVLDGMSTADRGVVAGEIGAALSTAQNAGRAAVFAAAPPVHLVATEILDKAACPRCRDIDGTRYPTVAAALADYAAAGYRLCEGGSRCRGYLQAEW